MKSCFSRKSFVVFLSGLVLGCGAVGVLSVLRGVRAASVEESWRRYVKLLNANPSSAYQCMSTDYRETHPKDAFLREWAGYHAQYLVTSNRESTIIYLGVSVPFTPKETVFVATGRLLLPLCLEDGFLGVSVTMRHERDGWKIDSLPGVIGR